MRTRFMRNALYGSLLLSVFLYMDVVMRWKFKMMAKSLF